MCQSAKTSLVAWIVATVIALLIISTGKPSAKWNGYFILTFILVQLLEFFIWHERSQIRGPSGLGLSSSAEQALRDNKLSENMTHQPSPSNRPSGEVFTRLILIALWLQPLVQTFMAYKYGRKTYKPQLMVITMAFFVMFIWSIVQALNPKEKFESRPVVGCKATCSLNGDCVGGPSSTHCDPSKPCPGGHLEWIRSESKGFTGGNLASGLYLFGLMFGLLFMQPGLFSIILLGFGVVSMAYSRKQLNTGETSSMWCLYAIGYAFVALCMAFSRKAPSK